MNTGGEDLEHQLKRIEIEKRWESDVAFSDIETVAERSRVFMEHALTTGDYRFLNTALKLNDWIRRNSCDGELIEQIEHAESESLQELRKRVEIEQ